MVEQDWAGEVVQVRSIETRRGRHAQAMASLSWLDRDGRRGELRRGETERADAGRHEVVAQGMKERERAGADRMVEGGTVIASWQER